LRVEAEETVVIADSGEVGTEAEERLAHQAACMLDYTSRLPKFKRYRQ